MTVRLLVLLPLAAALAALAACGTRDPVATPADVSIIRSYGWTPEVADPQPAWSPNDHRVAVRAANGLAILGGDDGVRAPEVYRSTERRETHGLAWINPEQVVFGPSRHVEKLPDGRVVPLVEGLTMVTLGSTPVRRQLTRLGFRPRVGPGRIFAQAEDKILSITEDGGIEEFGPGFFAEPQREGGAIAWQETPITETDHWTGRDGPGALVVRWKPGTADQLPRGVQPRWCHDGSLAATVVRATPPAAEPWWRIGTDVVRLAGPGATPVVVARDARDPAPHPTQPIIAVTGADGGAWLVSHDGTSSVRIADGCRPQWSFDGLRLLVEPAEAPAPTMTPTTAPRGDAPAAGARRITVHVLAIKPQAR